jgi:hypothetical protein
MASSARFKYPLHIWDYLMIMEFVTINPESAASLIGLIARQVKLTE